MTGSNRTTRGAESASTSDTAHSTQIEQTSENSVGTTVTSTAIPLRADKTLRGYSPSQVLTLQRTIGNKAVQQMVARTRQTGPARPTSSPKPFSDTLTTTESATPTESLNADLVEAPLEAATPVAQEVSTPAPIEQPAESTALAVESAAPVLERFSESPAAPVQRLSLVPATQVQRDPLSTRIWNSTKQTSKDLAVGGFNKGKSIAVGGYETGKSIASGGFDLGGRIAQGGIDTGKSIASGGLDLGGRIAKGGFEAGRGIASGGLDLGGRIAQGGLNAGKAIYNAGAPDPALAGAGGPVGTMGSGMATMGSALAGGTVAAGGGLAGGLTVAGGGLAGGATIAGGGLAGGATVAGGGLAGGLTAAGGVVGGGLTAGGGALAGGLTMAGGGVAGGLTMLGGGIAGGLTMAGGALAAGTVYAGEKIYEAGAYVADKVGGYFDKRAKLAEAKQYYKEAAGYYQEADVFNFQTNDLYMWMNADLGYLNDKQDKFDAATQKVAALAEKEGQLTGVKGDKAHKANLKRVQSELKDARKDLKKRTDKNINFKVEIPEAFEWATKAKQYKEESEASKQIVDAQYNQAMIQYKVAGIDYDRAKLAGDPVVIADAKQSMLAKIALAKVARDAAKASRDSMKAKLDELNVRKQTVLDVKKRGEKLSTYILKKIGSGLVSAATLGMVSVNINKAEGSGGYSSTRTTSFGPMQAIRDAWKQTRIDWANLKGLWKSRLMGPAPLTLFYGFLRFVADHVIKPIRDILAVVATVSGVLGLVTSLFAPPLAAVLATIATVCVGLALKLSIIKGMINGLLGLWGLVTMLASDLWSRVSNGPTDNAKNQMIRQREVTKQGMDLVQEGVRVAVPVGVTAGASINPNLPKLDARNAFSPGQEFSQIGNMGSVYHSGVAGHQSALGNRWVEGSNLGIHNVGPLSLGGAGKQGDTPALPAAVGGGRDYLVAQYNAEAEAQDPAAAKIRESRENVIKTTLDKVKAKLAALTGANRENQGSQDQVVTQLSAAQSSLGSAPSSGEQAERAEARGSSSSILEHLQGSQALSRDMSEAQSRIAPALTMDAVREQTQSGALTVESGVGVGSGSEG